MASKTVVMERNDHSIENISLSRVTLEKMHKSSTSGWKIPDRKPTKNSERNYDLSTNSILVNCGNPKKKETKKWNN